MGLLTIHFNKVRFMKYAVALQCFVYFIMGCKKLGVPANSDDSLPLAVNESASDYAPKLDLPTSQATAIPLDSSQPFLDIRGVGDSAWSGLRAAAAPKSEFGATLKKFDPTGSILRGDLNFINWESGVGRKCNSYFNVDYAFLSVPEAIIEAHRHGFNLFGLANNHSEDCRTGVDPDMKSVPGAVSTQRHMQQISNSSALAWHGVGSTRAELVKPAQLELTVKGRVVKVAFISVAFQGWDCVESTCEANVQKLFENARNTPADLRVLSLHSQGRDGFVRGKAWAEKFVTEYAGDIVFAHGPHTWAGVKALRKKDGSLGVVFHGLGNFLHNQVAPNPDNLIGRVLLDLDTLRPRQIQVIPVLNNAYNVDVVLASSSKSFPLANFNWARAELKAHTKINLGYAQLP